MRKVMAWAVAVFLSAFLVATVNAGSSDTPAIQKKEGQTQEPGQVVKGGQTTPGTSLLERYNKRVEIKKRAAERRNAEIQKSRDSNQGAGEQ